MIVLPLLVLLLLIPRGCDLLWGNAPMCVYGKLVDQVGNPVPDACVTFNGVSHAYFQLPLLTGQGR